MKENEFFISNAANIDFPHDLIADISLALMNCNVSNECPKCNRGKIKIVPSASITVLQNSYPAVLVNGRAIICAVTICDFCGHKEEYDLQRLGLLDKYLAFCQEVLNKGKDQ